MRARIRPNYDTPHGSTDASLPRAIVPKAPPELLAVQKHIKRTTGELVPIAELQRLRDGGNPGLSTPQIAIDAIRALPPAAKKRRRAPALLAVAALAVSGIAEAQMPMPEAPSGLHVGASGTHYQYDLSTPAGQIGYATDPGAQIRDSIMRDMPGPTIDRGLGQYGGGVTEQPHQHRRTRP